MTHSHVRLLLLAFWSCTIKSIILWLSDRLITRYDYMKKYEYTNELKCKWVGWACSLQPAHG